MRPGDEIINIAFHEQKTSVPERIPRLRALESESGSHFRDMAVASALPSYEALLEGGNPLEHAQAVFEKAQGISQRIIDNPLISPDIELTDRVRVFIGMSTEVAIHGLAWWGIANRPQNGVRWARLSSSSEDSSGDYGAKTGFDLMLRTDKNRWRIQTKTSLPSSGLETVRGRYSDDIIILTPQLVLTDQTATTLDIHRAIAGHDITTLDRAWNGTIREIKAQGSPTNNPRRVI